MQLGRKVRFWFLASLWILLTIAISCRLLYLATYQRGFLMDQSKARVERQMVINAKRGRILDRNGEILAMSKPAYDLWTVPKALLEDKQGCHELARHLRLSTQQLRERLTKNQQRDFFFLARNIDTSVANAIKDSDIKSVHSTPSFARFYPGGMASAAMVGIINSDGHGIEGMEYSYESILSGKNGVAKFVINPFGETVESIQRQESVPGDDVSLTIDRSVQYLTYEALKEGVEQTSAKAAHGVVLDVASGDIIAATSYPSFNPDTIKQQRPGKDSMRQRTFTDLFEPGSTFKPITMAYILENIPGVRAQHIQTAPGTLVLGENTVRDVRNYGMLELNDVLTKSSNIAMAKLLLQKPDGFIMWLKNRYHIDEKAQLPFPGLPKGSVITKSAISQFELATLSFGYGVSMSPVQLGQLYLSIANGGYWQPLSLVKSPKVDKGSQHRVMRAETAKEIRAMLHRATKQAGTAWRARVGGIDVAGKTGTTHVYDQGRYWDDRHIASFAGFAPLSDPRYVVVIVVEEPDEKFRYGGQAAAPIFSKIVFSSHFISSNDDMKSSKNLKQ